MQSHFLFFKKSMAIQLSTKIYWYFFYFSTKNMFWGTSSEYPKHVVFFLFVFLWRNKRNIYVDTPTCLEDMMAIRVIEPGEAIMGT